MKTGFLSCNFMIFSVLWPNVVLGSSQLDYYKSESSNIILISLIVLFIYYLIFWYFLVKKYTKKILPVASPKIPDLPLLAINRLNSPKHGLDVVLISLATKGFIKFKLCNSDDELNKSELNGLEINSRVFSELKNNRELNSEEYCVMRDLLSAKKSKSDLMLKNKNVQNLFVKMKTDLLNKFGNDFLKPFYYRHFIIIFLGVLFYFLTILVSLWSLSENGIDLIFNVFFYIILGCAAGVAFLLIIFSLCMLCLVTWSFWQNRVRYLFPLSFISLLGLFIFLIYSFINIYNADYDLETYALISIVFMNVIMIISYFLFKVPTEKGLYYRNKIQGLSMFLSGESIHDIAIFEENTNAFEYYLPYVVALDMQVRWCQRFNHYCSVHNRYPNFEWFPEDGQLLLNGLFFESLNRAMYTVKRNL